jgi:MtN3 and saliva related transmembrane protein
VNNLTKIKTTCFNCAFVHRRQVFMLLDIDNLIGYLSAFLTTIAFVPQAYQSWKTRDLSGISLPMYSLFTLGVAGWLGYGLVINSLPVIIANAITLILSTIQINRKD